MLAGQTLLRSYPHVQTCNRSRPVRPAIILAAAARCRASSSIPRKLMRNPVMFVTEVVAALVTILWLRDLLHGTGDAAVSGQIAAWLWFTVLFANFAEAVAEGRGKAQADAPAPQRAATCSAKRLLRSRRTATAFTSWLNALTCKSAMWCLSRRATDPARRRDRSRRGLGQRNRDHRRKRPGDPRGGRRPVGRDRRHDRRCPTGSWCGSRRSRARPFIDRMIALVEGAERQKTPNEIALYILLVGHDADLPVRRRHAVGLRRLFRHDASRSSCWWRCS